MDTLEITQTLKQLVAQAKLSDAFDLLLNFGKNKVDINKDLQQEIILLVSKYHALAGKSAKNTIVNSELNIEIKRVVHALFILIGEIEKTTDLQRSRAINAPVDDSFINKNKIRIAVLSANPQNTDPLRLDIELREIRQSIRLFKSHEIIKIDYFPALRIKDLQDCLLEYHPNFVHFAGHGNQDGIALLDSQTNELQLVRSEPLANLFKLFSNEVACVFLNSCFSKVQGELIRKYIPNVIGMNRAVPDPTAIEFATTFYKGIASGKEIGFSFELAKNSIDLHNISGNDIPVLL